MSFEITNQALLASRQLNIQPQIMMQIDGVSTIFSAAVIERVIRIGDPGLLIGDSWHIGDLIPIADQSDYISLDGMSTQITQQLNQDKGAGSSVASMQISLIDKNGEISKLITPGQIVADILGRRAKIFLGFGGTAFPDDYVMIFRGNIDQIDSGPGNVVFNISHPDIKKRQVIFAKSSPSLFANINNSQTTIQVDDVNGSSGIAPMFLPIAGPDGSFDPTIKYYVKIGDELIRYTGITGTTLTGCTRAQFGTVAASANAGDAVDTFYRLTGNCLDLALKIMLSGWNGPFVTGIAASAFNQVDADTNIQNAVFFPGIDLAFDYGLSNGDFMTITGASNGANNVSAKTISQIVSTNFGSYAVLNGVTFVDELMSSAVVDFRSQYDTLGEGLMMYPDEVDVDEHLRIQRLFLSSFQYDIYLKDDVDAKTFLDNEIYNPCAAYSIPRKAKASVGYHIGPIPSQNIKTLNKDNVNNPKKFKLSRSTAKNFFNTIIYKFDELATEDRFANGIIAISATSLSRVPVGGKALTIESKGLRTSLNAKIIAGTAGLRRLNRYKFGAEFFQGVEVMFRDGFSIEIGDIVIFDTDGLLITNTAAGDRSSSVKLYEVVNKSLDFKTGRIALDLVDTSFSTSARYALISPSSIIKSASSGTTFVIQSSFASIFGDNEFLKWQKYITPAVKVRNSDFSVLGTSTIKTISGNIITLSSSLGFTPLPGYVMELDKYNSCGPDIKIRHGFMTDAATFSDGKSKYAML